MVTKVHLEWLVQLKGELLGMGTPNHGPQQLSPLSQQTGYIVVDQCYGSTAILISIAVRTSNLACSVNYLKKRGSMLYILAVLNLCAQLACLLAVVEASEKFLDYTRASGIKPTFLYRALM
jgi:hypothetical protein